MGKKVGFKLFEEYFPEGSGTKRMTVAQLEYMRMRGEKSSNRFRLFIEGKRESFNVPPDNTFELVYESVKYLVSLGIENGEFKALCMEEAKLANDHLIWCRSSDHHRLKRHPETDGIVNRYRLNMREFKGEPWDEDYTKAVRLEVKLNGALMGREIFHLRWDTSLGSIAQKCVERIGQDLEDLSMQIKVGGKQITPLLEQQIAELGIMEDRLHLEIEFSSRDDKKY